MASTLKDIVRARGRLACHGFACVERHPPINAATRARIQRPAAEMGYPPEQMTSLFSCTNVCAG